MRYEFSGGDDAPVLGKAARTSWRPGGAQEFVQSPSKCITGLKGQTKPVVFRRRIPGSRPARGRCVADSWPTLTVPRGDPPPRGRTPPVLAISGSRLGPQKNLLALRRTAPGTHGGSRHGRLSGTPVKPDPKQIIKADGQTRTVTNPGNDCIERKRMYGFNPHKQVREP